MKSTKINKVLKEAETIKIDEYVDGDMQITETAKKIDYDTDIFTTPWGTQVKADDIVAVLEQYHALSQEDRDKEKDAWVELVSNMMGENDNGLKIVDIIMAPDGSRNVKFVYR